MDVQHDIESRMEKIRGIFQYAVSVSIDENDLSLLNKELIAIENEFRSIAYEAAAMRIAVTDISANNEFKGWKSFMLGPGLEHLTQVHVGLGWAMAQEQSPVFPFIKTLEPLMQCRVTDGYGYYEGIFRKRKTISKKQIPAELDNKFLHGYDQGLGRSIWYNSRGDCKKIAETIATFPASRQKDLWRGIGTACVYVGGYDENLLRELAVVSLDHYTQLSIGAALVSRTRTEAGALTRYIDMACRVWCNCSPEEAIEITRKTEPSATVAIEDPCSQWISNIEEVFI